VMYLASGL
jgi:5'-nucleotidase/UDP-sugar diphosphatase